MSSASSTPATTVRPKPQVSRSARQQVVRLGRSAFTFGDVYHAVLTMHLGVFMGLLVGAHVAANIVFALLFSIESDNIANATTALDRFFFSVQTWATIGYGGMTPKTTWANMLVVVESITAIVFTAVTTGLVFARFARPTARVLFARKAVITRRDGKPTLIVRVANERGNDVVEANARVTLLKDEVTKEGEVMRRLIDLKLVRDVQPLFIISWSLMHEIDESSPLFGKTSEEIIAARWQVIVNLTGHDGTLSQTIHASMFYDAADICFGERYVDVTKRLPDGRLQIDLTRFHDTEPQPAPT